MTTYGTIPTSSPGGGGGLKTTTSSNLEFISRAKQRIYTSLNTRKPWTLMLSFRSLSLPGSLHEAVSRLRTNLAFFLTNYLIVVLFVVFLSLLWHPISLIVFIIMMAAWLFLYFLRDGPLVVFGRTIDDRIVLVVLAVLTVVFLLLTHVVVNVVVSLAVGVVLVVVHGVFRRTDDLSSFEEEEDAGAGFLASTSAS